MNLQEYTQILVKGYLENSDNLARYLFRESKKAENEYIDNEEFFEGLNKVIKLFQADIDVQYITHLNLIDQMRDIRLDKGESIENLEDQERPKEYFNVFLPRVSGNLFSGNLPFQNLLFLESEISRAKELINDQIEILKTNKSQSGTASKGGISETDRYEIIDLGKVYKSYHEFNNDLFEVNFTDYQACFNLSIPEPTPLKFKPRQQTKFVYFLSQIPDVKNMAKIALSRFGLDNYYQQKGKAKPNQVFKNKVGTIFK
jgi:hypothetical protein